MKRFQTILFYFTLLNLTCTASRQNPVPITPYTPIKVKPSPKPVVITDTVIYMTSQGVNVKSFGAIGDGIHDDQPAIKAAIEHSIIIGSYSIFLPFGVYAIFSPILLSNGISMYGESMGYETKGKRIGSYIYPGTTMFSAILFDTSVYKAGGEIASRSTFRDFGIFAENSQYGIYCDALTYSTFDRLFIRGATKTGIHIEYGWCNSFVNCESDFNKENGIELFHSINATGVVRCYLEGNGAFGLVVGGMAALSVENCTIESNSAGGAYFIGGYANVKLDNNYFEDNGFNGWAFTTPYITVKADVLINGSKDNTGRTLDSSFAIKGMSFTNNYHNGNNYMYFINSANGVALDNNINLSKSVPLVGLMNTQDCGKVYDLKVGYSNTDIPIKILQDY